MWDISGKGGRKCSCLREPSLTLRLHLSPLWHHKVPVLGPCMFEQHTLPEITCKSMLAININISLKIIRPWNSDTIIPSAIAAFKLTDWKCQQIKTTHYNGVFLSFFFHILFCLFGSWWKRKNNVFYFGLASVSLTQERRLSQWRKKKPLQVRIVSTKLCTQRFATAPHTSAKGHTLPHTPKHAYI